MAIIESSEKGVSKHDVVLHPRRERQSVLYQKSFASSAFFPFVFVACLKENRP